MPPGFEIQLVAAEPDIHKPLNLAFDDRGRLWVTDTVEYPYPAAKGTKPRLGQDPLGLSGRRAGPQDRDVRRRPEHPDRPAAVAGGRAAIVHNIPNIYLMRDTDGDGRPTARGALRSLSAIATPTA